MEKNRNIQIKSNTALLDERIVRYDTFYYLWVIGVFEGSSLPILDRRLLKAMLVPIHIRAKIEAIAKKVLSSPNMEYKSYATIGPIMYPIPFAVSRYPKTSSLLSLNSIAAAANTKNGVSKRG